MSTVAAFISSKANIISVSVMALYTRYVVLLCRIHNVLRSIPTVGAGRGLMLGGVGLWDRRRKQRLESAMAIRKDRDIVMLCNVTFTPSELHVTIPYICSNTCSRCSDLKMDFRSK